MHFGKWICLHIVIQSPRMDLTVLLTRNQMLISVCETQKHIPNTCICLEAIHSYLFVSSGMHLNVRLAVCAHRWLQNGIYIYTISFLFIWVSKCVYIHICVRVCFCGWDFARVRTFALDAVCVLSKLLSSVCVLISNISFH